jgi:hypothetical protein
MIQRRHQIVHRADRFKVDAPTNWSRQTIEPAEVMEWLEATGEFMEEIIVELFSKLNTTEDLVKRLNIQIVKAP